MYTTLAIHGYRSLRDTTLRLGQITVVMGANGAGKSNLYKAMRLLAACGMGDVAGSLAREGGLDSVLWAGPESLAGARRGHPIQGTVRSGPISLRLGIGGDSLSYLVDLGLPMPGESLFGRDPEIKREALRHLMWLAALLAPSRPPLMAINEPENSLHPTLLAPLARLLARASLSTQLVVVTHSLALVEHLSTAMTSQNRGDDLELTELVKDLGETIVQDQGLLSRPVWEWGSR